MLDKYLKNESNDSFAADINEIRYAERKRNFGQLLIALRKEKGWTRKVFASKVPLIPTKTIGDIERGEKAFLDHITVTRLADALELKGLMRAEFFGYAGLSEDESSQKKLTMEQETVIHHFYESISYPAFVHDPLFNLHSANSDMFSTFGIYLDERISKLFSACKGNLLRMLFDPQFPNMTALAKNKQWRRQVEIYVYMFRIFSKHHVGNNDYVMLIRELKMLPEFQDVWKTVEEANFLPLFPVPMQLSLKTGEGLRFMITSTTDIGLQVSNLNKVIYIPVDQQTKEVLAKSMVDIPHMYIKLDNSQPEGFSTVALSSPSLH